MEDKNPRDDEIDITEYLDFLKRRKWCVIITTVVCLAAGWAYALRAPAIYTVRAIIEPPSVVSPENLSVKINERVFGETAGRILDETQAKASVIRAIGLIRLESDNLQEAIGLIRLESDNLQENEVENHIKLFYKLFDQIHGQYHDKIAAEKDMLSKRITNMQTSLEEETKLAELLKEILEYENKEVALALNLLYRKVLFIESIILNVEMLEQLKSKTQNIKVVKEPHIAKKREPRMNLSLAIAGFTGIIAGIVIGVIKDYYTAGKKS